MLLPDHHLPVVRARRQDVAELRVRPAQLPHGPVVARQLGRLPALGAVADIGCLSYFAVLSYYATVLLPTVGRSGRAARPKLMDLTPIGAWRALGFISDDALAPTAAAPVDSAEGSAPLDRFRSLMGTLYGIAGIAHAADLLIGPSALLTAAGAPPFQDLPPPAQALAGLWCLAGPLAYLTSRRGGRAVLGRDAGDGGEDRAVVAALLDG